MNARHERIAKNENVLRAANREIEQAEKQVADRPVEIEVLCECGRADCQGLVTLTLAEYEEAHAEADRFVVLPGHSTPEIERIVEQRPGYHVVDKFGKAEKIAEDEAG